MLATPIIPHLFRTEFRKITAVLVKLLYGKEAAIIEAEKLQLTSNPYYFSLLGELYTGIDNDKAKQHFEKAMALAKTLADRHVIQKKLMNIA